MAFEILPPEQPRSLVVHPFNAQGVLDKVATDIQIAPHLIIDSDDMLAEAQQVAGRLATAVKSIESERKQRKQPVLDAAAWLDEGYGKARDYLNELIDGIRPKILAYQQHLRAEAQRKADEERARREAAAAEAAAAEAAALAASKAALDKASQAREAGSEIVAATMEQSAVVAVDEARERAAQAAAQVAAPVFTAPTKVKGARVKWKGRVTNKAEAVAFIGKMVAEGNTSLLHLLEIDESALNKQADLQRAAFNVPGLQAYEQESVSIRGVAV